MVNNQGYQEGVDELIRKKVYAERKIEEVKQLCEECIAWDSEHGFFRGKIDPEEIANVFGWKIVKSAIYEYELRGEDEWKK